MKVQFIDSERTRQHAHRSCRLDRYAKSSSCGIQLAHRTYSAASSMRPCTARGLCTLRNRAPWLQIACAQRPHPSVQHLVSIGTLKTVAVLERAVTAKEETEVVVQEEVAPGVARARMK